MKHTNAAYVRFEVITKSDTVNIAGGLTDAIMVGTAGALAAVSESDVVTTITLPVGLWPLRVKRVNSTNTTAAAMTACYYQ